MGRPVTVFDTARAPWIEEAVAACDAATPGPWSTDGYRFYYGAEPGEGSWGEFKHDDTFHRGDEDFIVGARTWLPMALAALNGADIQTEYLTTKLVIAAQREGELVDQVDGLLKALTGLLRGCQVYESAHDTEEGSAFYEGAKRAAKRVLASSVSEDHK